MRLERFPWAASYRPSLVFTCFYSFPSTSTTLLATEWYSVPGRCLELPSLLLVDTQISPTSTIADLHRGLSEHWEGVCLPRAQHAGARAWSSLLPVVANKVLLAHGHAYLVTSPLQLLGAEQ